MPLPLNPATPWPPKEIAHCLDQYAEHAAWYSANSQRLADYYSGAAYTPTPKGHIWARQTRERVGTAVHMPLAADIATVSADLLFSEAPKFVIPEAQEKSAPRGVKEAQDRLEDLIEEAGIYNRLLEAAETAAAMGGVYLRPVWDAKVINHPLLSAVQPDAAIPEFRWGILVAVTFWSCVYEDEKDVIRHLERHEVNAQGQAVILHGLYRGKKDRLGVPIPLDSYSQTASLLPAINTGIDGLDVRYIPNILPNRLDRGSPLGSSDYQGKEGLFASLDETWTSLVRDLSLSKARIYVPEEYIDSRGKGDHIFDIDEEIFVPLDIDPIAAQNHKIDVQQPELRVEQHLAMATAMVTEIVSRCGYAPQTFGLGIEGQAESGTALRLRERKSLITMGKKQRYWKSPLQDIMYMMLQLDATLFNSGIELPDRISATFADSVAPDIKETAQTLNLLKLAEAVSIKTKIKMLHPEWLDEEVEAEYKLIKEETAGGFGMGGDPTGGALDALDKGGAKKPGSADEETDTADEGAAEYDKAA